MKQQQQSDRRATAIDHSRLVTDGGEDVDEPITHPHLDTELPGRPAYDSPTAGAIDDALVDLLTAARNHDDEYFQRIAASELGSFRLGSGVDEPGDNHSGWLPESYDTDAPLIDRLPIMAGIDGGIELHAVDPDGQRLVVGEPHKLTELPNGGYELRAGGTEFNWSHEIVVPTESEAYVRSVDTGQDIEAYEDSKRRELEAIDVRIWGVDVDREAAEADLGVTA